MTIEELEAKNKELQDALDKAGSGLDDEARKRLEHLESENKDLIGARDKAKAKVKEVEEKKLLDNQEFKTLAETRQTELDALTTERDKMAVKIGIYEKRDEERLVKLLESVPDQFKGIITDDLPISKRLEMAETFAAQKVIPPGTRLPGEGNEFTGKNPFKKETLNLTEQARLLREDKTKYDQLKAEAGR